MDISTVEIGQQVVVTMVNCTLENIPKSSMADLSYLDFFTYFMSQNIPCVISDVTKNWNCSKLWIHSNVINYEYFNETYGEYEVPVADCNKFEYNAQCKKNMLVKEYIFYLENKAKDQISNNSEVPILYLKDWHLKRLHPKDAFYSVPIYFASDWLNEYAIDNNEDDFMFTYIGTKNSWTPLHADVYNSFSWSANVIGRKRWLLFPPGETDKMKDSLGNLPLNAESKLSEHIKYYDIIQEQGDALFVPSGWYHQVYNLTDTISINHNWVNGCNIQSVWMALQENLVQTQKEIEEFKDSDDWHNQCQKILKIVFGMDFSDFFIFILHIARKRLHQINNNNKTIFDIYQLGPNHILFDLTSIKSVFEAIVTHPHVNDYCIQSQLLEDINIILKNLKVNFTVFEIGKKI